MSRKAIHNNYNRRRDDEVTLQIVHLRGWHPTTLTLTAAYWSRRPSSADGPYQVAEKLRLAQGLKGRGFQPRR